MLLSVSAIKTLTFNLLGDGDDGEHKSKQDVCESETQSPNSTTREVVDVEDEQLTEAKQEIVKADVQLCSQEIAPSCETQTVTSVEISEPLLQCENEEEAVVKSDDRVCSEKEHTSAKSDSPRTESKAELELPSKVDDSDLQEQDISFKDDSGLKGAIGWGHIGRIGLAKVKVAKAKGKLTPDKTVAARLDKLEQSLSSLMEDMSSTKQIVDGGGQWTETESESRDDILSRRIHAVETFLQGFAHDDDVVTDETTKHEDSSESPWQEALDEVVEGEYNSQPPQVEDSLAANNFEDESESLASTEQAVVDDSKQTISCSIDNDSSYHQDHASTQLSRRGSLLFHLNERESRTDLSIDDLAQQISALRQNIEEQKNTNSRIPSSGFVATDDGTDGIDTEEIHTKITELGEQLADLVVSLDDKVSSQDFEARIHEMCTTLARSKSVDDTTTTTTRNESEHISPSSIDDLTATVKEQMEQISKLEVNKLDIDKFDQQLQHMEDGIKSLLAQEITKQQNEISAHTEKTENDFVEIKSLIDAQNDALVSLRDEANTAHNVSSDDDIIQSSIKEEEVEERIRQVTALLEERLDRLSAIENEWESLTSKLAEKPSQDQIDAMLCDIEKRLGKNSDEALHDMIQNMKMELQHKITRGEVMTMVKQTIREAKLGIQNTKDSLMIGTTAYCLGCSQAFPAGVNGIRARKTFDSLPPAGLVSNATLYGNGNSNGGRRSIRPLQTLRSSSIQQRPKSAIIGRFSPSSLIVQSSIETSRVLPSSR